MITYILLKHITYHLLYSYIPLKTNIDINVIKSLYAII